MFKTDKRVWIVVLVGALGYFIDIYDLVLFSILRVASLRDLMVSEADLLDVGVTLLNSQMFGMLIGGVLWGMLGDKKGRISVLFGSIFLYSISNIANGFVTSVPAYAALRFIAGIGLAGELGAAITLVSEILPKETRGYGTAIVASIGLSGAIAAGITTEYVGWRASYWIGGGLGLVLLVLRLGILESSLFANLKKEAHIKRGDLKMLVSNPKRLSKYIYCILIGIPIWYCAGVLMTFSPELGKELQTLSPLVAGKSIMYSYVGVALGDLLSGVLSQWIKSRKKVVIGCMIAELIVAFVILLSRGLTSDTYYFLCFLIGLATGYWAVFVTMAAEQFGTNMRATVTTSVPNFVRGSVVPMTLSFRWLGASTSLVTSAMIVGVVVHVVAFLAVLRLEETHGRDLNFVEV